MIKYKKIVGDKLELTGPNLQLWPKSNLLADFDDAAHCSIIAEPLDMQHQNRRECLNQNLLLRLDSVRALRDLNWLRV